MDAATKEALAALRRRQLLSFRAEPGEARPRWHATPMGRAVHDSALPIAQGEALYRVGPCARLHANMAHCIAPWCASCAVIYGVAFYRSMQ